MSQVDQRNKRLEFHFNGKLTLFVVLLFPCLVSLGFWQLDRADEKRQIQHIYQNRQSQQAVPIDKLLSEPAQDLEFRRVSLNGRFINNNNILVDNQIYQSQFGYEVITPFWLSSDKTIILVSRGWIAGDYDRTKWPVIEAIEGEQGLAGEIYISDKKPFSLGETHIGNSWPKRLPFIDVALLTNVFDLPLFPYLVRLDEGSPGVLQRHWRIVAIQSDKHQGYAIQWFAMSATLLFLYLAFSSNLLDFMRLKNRNKQD